MVCPGMRELFGGNSHKVILFKVFKGGRARQMANSHGLYSDSWMKKNLVDMSNAQEEEFAANDVLHDVMENGEPEIPSHRHTGHYFSHYFWTANVVREQRLKLNYGSGSAEVQEEELNLFDWMNHLTDYGKTLFSEHCLYAKMPSNSSS